MAIGKCIIRAVGRITKWNEWTNMIIVYFKEEKRPKTYIDFKFGFGAIKVLAANK